MLAFLFEPFNYLVNMQQSALPKGLTYNPTTSKASRNKIFQWGNRYFIKGKAKWFGYYEELTEVEKLQLYSYFTKYVPGVDPFEGAQLVTEQELKTLSVDTLFPKIEAAELCRLLKLYQYYCNGFKSRPTLEVGVLLFYNSTLNKIKFLLPNQTVSGASWDWNIAGDKPILFLDPSFNPVDGSFLNIEQIQASGWEHIGTSHSHNTIASRWSNGPTGDYKNQAGSKEKPLPPMLHLLVYAMSNYQTDDMPSFNFLSSVNVLGDLIDLDPSLVLEDSNLDYKSVSWIGGDVAEKLAKIVVYQTPKNIYAGYYQPQYFAPKTVKADTTVVDAEATLSWLKQKSTSDPLEANHRVQLAVDLVEELPAEDILNCISLLVHVLSQSSLTFAEIYDDVIKSSYILEEGFVDYFGFDTYENEDLEDVGSGDYA